MHLRELRNRIGELFTASQHQSGEHQLVLVARFMQLFTYQNRTIFGKVFTGYTFSVMTNKYCSHKTRRTLDFIATVLNEIAKFESENVPQFPCSTENDDAADEPSNVDTNVHPEPFVDTLIRDCLIQVLLGVIQLDVRLNCTSLIDKIMNKVPRIGASTRAALKQALLTKSKDRNGMVRAICMLAMKGFQAKSIEGCEVTECLLFHGRFDPCVASRLCALKALNYQASLREHFIRNLLHSNDRIREAAFQKLAEAELSDFKGNEVLSILQHGVKERQASVKKVFLESTICKWLDIDGFCQLFAMVQVEKNHDVCMSVVQEYFRSLSPVERGRRETSQFVACARTFIQKHSKSPSLRRVVPDTNLTAEVCFFWKELCKFSHDHKVSYQRKPIASNQDDVNEQEVKVSLLSDLLPDVKVYCDYVEKFVQNVCTFPKPEQKQTACFIFSRLLEIGALLEIKGSDEWQVIHQTFTPLVVDEKYSNVFTHSQPNHIQRIVLIFSKHFLPEEQEAFFEYVLSIVKDIDHAEDREKEVQVERNAWLDQKGAGDSFMNRSSSLTTEIVQVNDIDHAEDREKEARVESFVSKPSQHAAGDSVMNKSSSLTTEIVQVNDIEHAEDPGKEVQVERNARYDQQAAGDSVLNRSSFLTTEIVQVNDIDQAKDSRKEVQVERNARFDQQAAGDSLVNRSSFLTTEIVQITDEQRHDRLQLVLNIILGFYQSSLITKSWPLLVNFIRSHIAINLGSSHAHLVRLSMHILALHCHCQPDWINGCLKAFIAILYNQAYGENRVDALRILTVFVAQHGLEQLDFVEENPLRLEWATMDASNVLDRCDRTPFKQFFLEMIEEFFGSDPIVPSTEIQYKLFEAAVQSVCTLLYKGRLECSPMILRRLIMIISQDSDVSTSTTKDHRRSLINFVQGTLLAYTDKLMENRKRPTSLEECTDFLLKRLDESKA